MCDAWEAVLYGFGHSLYSVPVVWASKTPCPAPECSCAPSLHCPPVGKLSCPDCICGTGEKLQTSATGCTVEGFGAAHLLVALLAGIIIGALSALVTSRSSRVVPRLGLADAPGDEDIDLASVAPLPVAASRVDSPDTATTAREQVALIKAKSRYGPR